jgi:hypothetical protein
MAANRAVIVKRMKSKTFDNGTGAAPSALPCAVGLSQPKGATERSDSFDPRLLLTKLSAEKTTQEYKVGEFVFSQGDTADAVSTSGAVR